MHKLTAKMMSASAMNLLSRRLIGTSLPRYGNNVAVVLSGNGVYDGSEVSEI